MSSPAWATPHPTSGAQLPPVVVQQQQPQAQPQQQGLQDPNDILLQPYSTLDEPVMETIMRDVRAVGSKLKVVMLPLDRNAPFQYIGVSQEELGENQKRVIETLRDWDLWGPLLICLSLSVILALKSPRGQEHLVFASVFVVVWLGSGIVTLNAQLLGGTISFFQSLCVLGYCVFPMMMAALLIGLLKLTPIGFVWLDLIWLALAFLWATRASSVFIGLYIKKERRLLAVFPVLFFYIFLGWMILLF